MPDIVFLSTAAENFSRGGRGDAKQPLHDGFSLCPNFDEWLTLAVRRTDWLLAYEGGRREWLDNTNDRFIQSHPYFGAMLAADVEFYDENAKLTPLFEFAAPRGSDDDFDFDTDKK
jgi:hypothetical protein